MKEQIQVEWSNPMATDITWEDAVELWQCFPSSPAWGQAVSQGPGDVSTDTAGTDASEPLGLSQRQSRPKRFVRPNRKYLGGDWTT
jgi:hypothetical protein